MCCNMVNICLCFKIEQGHSFGTSLQKRLLLELQESLWKTNNFLFITWKQLGPIVLEIWSKNRNLSGIIGISMENQLLIPNMDVTWVSGSKNMVKIVGISMENQQLPIRNMDLTQVCGSRNMVRIVGFFVELQESLWIVSCVSKTTNVFHAHSFNQEPCIRPQDFPSLVCANQLMLQLHINFCQLKLKKQYIYYIMFQKLVSHKHLLLTFVVYLKRQIQAWP